MGDALFLAARAATERRNRARVEGDPLLDTTLHAFVHSALCQSRGSRIDGTTIFPAVFWFGGATDTYNGQTFVGTIEQFVGILQNRAQQIAPKRMGWIVEPVTNPTGRRTNQATLAVHALFLDADGTGEWHPLLNTLSALSVAFIAYQSGGWTPSVPKWRVVIPLSQSFDTTTESKQTAWKAIYNHARTVFGALGQLRGIGFDPATETPCSPWFLTERRSPDDPQRLVYWHPGHALDLTAFALALPDPPPEDLFSDHVAVKPFVENTIDAAHLRKIVEALTVATSYVPLGRRDLYLSLTGALLDRGVSAENTMTIIEAVSSSYPRRHPEKHRDNLHNARTTINRWLSGERVTRIGTLNAVAPAIAHVLDAVLPGSSQMLAATTAGALEVQNRISSPTPPLPLTTPAGPSTQPVPTVKLRRGALSELGREIASIGKKLKDEHGLERLIISQFVAGAPLPENALTTEIIGKTMLQLGRYLTVTVSWADVLDFSSLSLGAFTQNAEAVNFIEQSFYTGRAKLIKFIQKRNLEAVPFLQARESLFKDIK